MTTLTVRHNEKSILDKVSYFLSSVVESLMIARAARASYLESKKSDVTRLYRIAQKYENIQPNLAAELRSIAARG
jgi:hypothetical protein